MLFAFQVSCTNNQVYLLKMPNMEVMRSIAGIKVCNLKNVQLFSFKIMQLNIIASSGFQLSIFLMYANLIVWS